MFHVSETSGWLNTGWHSSQFGFFLWGVVTKFITVFIVEILEFKYSKQFLEHNLSSTDQCNIVITLLVDL